MTQSDGAHAVEEQRTAYPPSPQPTQPAHIIGSDEEAIEIATRLASGFAEKAAERDRERRLPLEEIDTFSQSGLWAMTIPKSYGGAEVSCVTLARVIKIIAAAHPSIAQIPQNHFSIVDLIRISGTDDQRRLFFEKVLKGIRLGNAFSERKTKNVADLTTRLVGEGDDFVVTGTKFYSTGALFAHFVPVAALDEEGKLHVAIADRASPGLSVVDDWSSFGQRTTASGTVTLDKVRVPGTHVIPAYRAFETPTANGPHAQLVHAAVDLGIAMAAIDETISFVRTQARPWIDSAKRTRSKILTPLPRSATSTSVYTRPRHCWIAAGSKSMKPSLLRTKNRSARLPLPLPRRKSYQRNSRYWRRTSSLSFPARHRLWKRAVWTGTGETRAFTPFMIPSAGNTSRSVISI
jgi:hypothetical protein